MAYTTIDKPTDYFNTKIYAPDGSSSFAVTGVGFQPDWVWLKSRNYAEDHQLNDSVRGATKGLQSNKTSAETTQSNGLTSFDSDGFTVGNLSDYNYSGDSIVSWNWLADNTSGSSNTDGSITSTVSANTTAGFSIVSWTGTAANATVGHGLGQVLDMVIVKNRDDADDWITWHNALAGTEFIRLNLDNSKQTGATRWNSTIPTSSVFSLGSSNGSNGSSDNMIAYCFAEKKGYSKFGTYTGNGNADGPFVYTGFKPALVLVKRSSDTGSWLVSDSKRNTHNVVNLFVNPDTSAAETTGSSTGWLCDFTSNGFKVRGSGAGVNGSGSTIIFMAFAESPFVSSGGIPTTAR